MNSKRSFTGYMAAKVLMATLVSALAIGRALAQIPEMPNDSKQPATAVPMPQLLAPYDACDREDAARPRPFAGWRSFSKCPPANCIPPVMKSPVVTPESIEKTPITEPSILPPEAPQGAESAQPSPLAATTSAALGGAAVSINMFGDQGAGGGTSSFTIFTKFPASSMTITPVSSGPTVYTFSGNGVSFTSVPNSSLTKVGDAAALNNSQPGAGLASINGFGFLDAIVSNGSTDYFGHVEYFQQFQLNIPNPAAGGMVGNQKISEDNNPLPRDRLIFNYDYFAGTPVTLSGLNINRVILGFEKTFFDRLASIEVRVPFAATLDSDIVVGTQATSAEFGNVRVNLKGLLWSGPVLNVGGGLAMYLPTANDTRVFLADGTELVRIENRSVVLTPYLGFLFTPTQRSFMQVWGAGNFDTAGNPVLINSDLTTLQYAGRMQAQSVLEADVQIGYWLRLPGSPGAGLLRGLAPFFEMHYGSTVQNADLVTLGSFVIGDLNNRVDQLNLAGGLAAVLGRSLYVSTGVVVPVSSKDNRTFDYQIGVRASWFFGPTARAQNPVYGL